MKVNWKFTVAMLFATAFGSTVMADTEGQSSYAVSDAAYALQDDDASASDAPPAPAEVPVPEADVEDPAPLMMDGKAVMKGDDCGCDKGDKGGKCDESCDIEPCELLPETCCGIKIGGWFQMGYHTAGNPAVSAGLGGGAGTRGTTLFNNRPNEVQLQQAWIYAEKEADTGGCGWDWGFRVDYVYGTDGPNTQAFGSQAGDWDTSWDNGPDDTGYGSALPQVYATLAYNDLTVKAGHFYTIIGYEVVTAPDNFFYSHAFTMNNNEPFTHTGVLAEYAYGDNVTAWGGWTQGWDTGFSDNGGSSFLGGVSLAATDSLTLTYTVVAGDFGADDQKLVGDGSDDNAYMNTILADWSINDDLNYVFQFDYQDNQIGLEGNGKQWSVVNYLLYTVNDCWKAGARLEHFENSSEEQINSFTFGLNYTPHTNLIIRPEYRSDNWEAYGTNDLFGIDAIVLW